MVGFFISTPVGPVGVLCIRRILTEGRLVGFVSGLGAAAADALYAALAAFGLTFITGILIDNHIWMRLGGGVFLIFFGIRIFISRPEIQSEAANVIGLLGDFASVFLLALSNPMIILSMAAIFAALGLTIQGGSYLSLSLLVGGVFTGSALWWVILSILISFFRLRLGRRELAWINSTAGTIIAGFGLLVMISLLLLGKKG